MTYRTFEDLDMLTLEWARERSILKHSTAQAQITKTQEELDELKEALDKGDLVGTVDGFGDVLVTLIIAAELKGLDLVDCLNVAYEEIKDRKGYLNADGIFVKES